MANSKNSKSPPKWVYVYPQGTKEGDEEQKFFIALARHPKYNWRSVSAIAAESGLTKKRVEEIISKYYKKSMVFQNPKNADQWGYWERVPDMLQDDDSTIVQKDQQKRIDDTLKASMSCTVHVACPGDTLPQVPVQIDIPDFPNIKIPDFPEIKIADGAFPKLECPQFECTITIPDPVLNREKMLQDLIADQERAEQKADLINRMADAENKENHRFPCRPNVSIRKVTDEMIAEAREMNDGEFLKWVQEMTPKSTNQPADEVEWIPLTCENFGSLPSDAYVVGVDLDNLPEIPRDQRRVFYINLADGNGERVINKLKQMIEREKEQKEHLFSFKTTTAHNIMFSDTESWISAKELDQMKQQSPCVSKGHKIYTETGTWKSVEELEQLKQQILHQNPCLLKE